LTVDRWKVERKAGEKITQRRRGRRVTQRRDGGGSVVRTWGAAVLRPYESQFPAEAA